MNPLGKIRPAERKNGSTMTHATRARERLSVYRLMPDEVLREAIRSLERTCSRLSFCVADGLRAAYQDALCQALAEQERRRC